MLMEDKIRQAIEQGIRAKHIEVINESHKHEGHAGHDGSGQSHFKLIVASNDFEGMSKVQRQRVVNKLLSEHYDSGIHALSMTLLTESE